MNLKYKDDKQKECLEMLTAGDLLIGDFHLFNMGDVEIITHSVYIGKDVKSITCNQKIIDGVVEIFARMPEGYVKIWGSKPW